MKKLLLLSILLIVGCATTTTAKFYIGMPIDEFADNNPHICSNYDSGWDNNLWLIENAGIKYVQGYLFHIEDDTLRRVYSGTLNAFILKKEIDYDKYATPPE